MSKITEKTPDAGLKMILLIPKDYNGDSSNLTEFLQAADKLGIEVQKDEKKKQDFPRHERSTPGDRAQIDSCKIASGIGFVA